VIARKSYRPTSWVRCLGGTVTVAPVRDRTGDGDTAFSVAFHSNRGDLLWISPRIATEDGAEIAANTLAAFIGGKVRHG